MSKEKINFRVARDFGEIFNVSIKFIRQNFKLFFQCLLFIAGPFVLISAIAGAFYQAHAISLLSLSRNTSGSPFAYLMNQFGWEYALFILSSALSSLALLATVYSFMIEYNEKGPEGFTVSDVNRRVISNIGNVFAVFIVMALLTLLFVIVIVGIFIGITAASTMLGVFLAFFLIIVMFIIFPPLAWQLSATYLVKMTEDKGVFESFGRTRQVMHGNFWWTWVVVVCAMLGVGLASAVFAIPQSVMQMVLTFTHAKSGNGDTSVSFMIVATVCTFCSTLLYSVMSLINGFYFFSLAEKDDGKGLMERINEIGQTPKTDVEQQY